jgi:hypothetical protein
MSTLEEDPPPAGVLQDRPVAKLASLANEFKHWKDITKAAGGVGRKRFKCDAQFFFRSHVQLSPLPRLVQEEGFSNFCANDKTKSCLETRLRF